MARSGTRSASLVFSHSRKLAGCVIAMPAYSSRWKASTALQSMSGASTSASMKSSWELPVLTTMRARPRVAMASRRMTAAAAAAAPDASRLDENTCTRMAPAWNVPVGDDMLHLSIGFGIWLCFRPARGDQQADYQCGGKRHGAGGPQHRLEGVVVGGPANQVGGKNGPQAGASAAHAAHRGHLRRRVEIGRQRQCHGGPCRIAERGNGEEADQQREVIEKRRRDEACHACTANHHHEFASPHDGPTTANQVTGEPASGEITQVGGQEGNPEAGESVLQAESLRHQVDREPVGDKIPNRVGERPPEYDAPGLPHAEQAEPRLGRRRNTLSRVRPAAQYILALLGPEPGMSLRRMVESPPHQHPAEAEHSRHHEDGAPAAEGVI